MRSDGGASLNPQHHAWPFILVSSAVAAGFFLRVDNLANQIVMDDELHSVRALVEDSYWWIFRSFGDADVSIPQTVISKIIFQTTGLDEFTLRLLPLFFGVLLLVVLPVIVLRRFGALTSVITAWLCALSPLLVLYSRYARPYSASIFLVTLGVISFIFWSEGRRRFWLVMYVFCGVFTTYFQLLSLVAVLAPLVANSVSNWRNRDRLRSNFNLGLAVVICCGLLLLPALLTNFDQLTQKVNESNIGWASIDQAARLLVGTGQGWVCLMLLFVGVLAIWHGFRSDPHLAMMLVSPLLVQLFSLVILGPNAIEFSIVLARYLVWCWPPILLAAAWGLSRKLESGGRCDLVKWPLLVLLPVFIFFVGPLPGMFSYNNELIIPKQFARTLARENHPVPDIYRKLAGETGNYALLEVPYVYYYSIFPYDDYQRVHKKDMYMGFINTWGVVKYQAKLDLGTPGLEFKKFVNLDDSAGLAARGIKYIILHFNLLEEIGLSSAWGNTVGGESMDTGLVRRYLEGVYGPAVYLEKNLAVYETGLVGTTGTGASVTGTN